MTSWLCHSHDPTKNASCGRIFYREETYLQHLGQLHRIPKNKSKTVLSASRLDIADSNRFWCGFCCKFVALSAGGSAGLDERFNHIDVEHFKKGERGGDWRFPGGLDSTGIPGSGSSGTTTSNVNGCNELVEGVQGCEGDNRRKRRCPGL